MQSVNVGESQIKFFLKYQLFFITVTKLLYFVLFIFVSAESPSVPNNMGSLQSVNLDVMLRHTFVPDYTVRAVMDVLYIRVRRSAYLAAKQATLMAISRKDSTDEHFDDEVEKVLRLTSCIVTAADSTYCFLRSCIIYNIVLCFSYCMQWMMMKQEVGVN